MRLQMTPGTRFQWSSRPRRVLLSAEPSRFSSKDIGRWRDEGFTISYLPFKGSQKDFASHLTSIAESLQFGEEFALVAYGKAATAALDACMKPVSRLCALVCFYPTRFPNSTTCMPPNLHFVVHLSAGQQPASRYPSYSYPSVQAGFAEFDHTAYDQISDGLAWTRTLGTVRRGLGINVDLEGPWEKHVRSKFMSKDVTQDTVCQSACVRFISSGVDVTGLDNIHKFYQDSYTSQNPPSFKMKLLSRTSGVDQVVDEMLITFKHTTEIPWMLPKVSPTNKGVEITLVSVARLRGGKLSQEHVYWDQASVLAQVGLVDPKTLPPAGPGSSTQKGTS